MYKNKSVIIFDFDGTLGDTFDVILKIYNNNAPSFGLKTVKQKDLENLRNLKLSELFKELNISKSKAPFLIYQCTNEFKREIKYVKPFKEIPELLKILKTRGYKLGILTSNTRENVEIFLENNELKSYFSFVCTSKNIFGKDKALTKIFKKFEINKNDVIYIGDEVRDVEASKKINISVIGVSWGFNSKKVLLSFLPDAVLDTPRQLIELLDS